jgi:prophage antirepressor-like protein
MNTTANSLTAFTFQTSPTKGPNQKHSLRVVTIAGEPWFVAQDLNAPLGMYPSLLSGRLKFMHEFEKKLVDGRQFNLIELGQGGQMKRWLVSESGLYKLIMRSDKREAQAFQDWVTCDVIPTIRKTGSYGTGPVDGIRELVDRIKKLEDKIWELERPKITGATDLSPSFMKARAFLSWRGLKCNSELFSERSLMLRAYCDNHSLQSFLDTSGKTPVYIWPLAALEAVFVDGWCD